MGNYWAIFKEFDGHTYRYDTRIYLEKIQCPTADDFCIGAIIGKNPGSAKPASRKNLDLQEIDLDGDKLLPTLRSIMIKAHIESKIPIKSGSFVQVLNLVYLCDKDLSQAIWKTQALLEQPIRDCESKCFPFVWYVWGGSNKDLNDYKHSFENIRTEKHFFFDNTQKRVIEGKPSIDNNARHTQGLKT